MDGTTSFVRTTETSNVSFVGDAAYTAVERAARTRAPREESRTDSSQRSPPRPKSIADSSAAALDAAAAAAAAEFRAAAKAAETAEEEEDGDLVSERGAATATADAEVIPTPIAV